MFRTNYTDLTPEQIGSALASAPAPRVPSPAPKLSGTELSIVTDGGPKLKYSFSGREVTLSVNGKKSVTTAYGAQELRSLLLVSCLVPGTQSSYHLVLDRSTGLATVFEVWFSDPAVKLARESRREIWFGYAAEKGKKAPEGRHGFTSRFENKGIVWTDDRGEKLLIVSNSCYYSTMVQLNAPDGGITVAFPSDYIKISDEQYIYARNEAEFSGTFVLAAIDLFRMKEIGARLGFDEHDKLDWRMFTAEGELAGQLATFGKFTDYGGSYDVEKMGSMVMPDEKVKKGRRPIYRVHGEYPDITPEQAKNAGAEPHSFPIVDETVMPSGNSMPDSPYLIGIRFTLRMDDGPAWEYQITGLSTLRWREAGKRVWHDETYKAFEPDEDLILFAHVQTGTPYGRGITAAVDFKNGCVTVFHSKIGNAWSNREVGYDLYFGVLEMRGLTPPERLRHTRTTELVGRAFTWNYSGGENGITSMHVYSSPWAASWTIFLDNQEGGMVWSSPAAFVKLRGDCYMMSWVEETSAGGHGIILMYLRTMHDCGIFYGLSFDGSNMVGMSSIGAFARDAGRLDILKYFTP
ncbi:MAG: MoaF N-terminal domain-containing protein [Oscillospiraceae bacterium]|nr:MoaF N-terminal domain-containing protein [Oscillospiraceae bacterium]